MLFDPVRGAIAALRLRSRIAALAPGLIPADNAGCTDTKALSGSPAAQSRINRSQRPDPEIN
jgi:hypothetical protein